MIILYFIFSIIFLGLALFSFISVITFIKTFIQLKKLDELQKNVIYESLAISFLIIVAINLIQLIVSIVTPEPIAYIATTIISPGAYKGVLFSNSPLHFDSFLIDNLILGIVYYVKRKKYGLI